MYAGDAAASAREMPAPMPAAGLDREEAAVQPVAEGQEAGAFFEYRVTTPVSVKRGESALVPIISADIAYTRELLYNGAKLPSHPVVALRFANTTGLTLERGPVTIVEDGEYRGEAVIPFTKSGSEVYLAYAVELGVRVVERSARHTEMAGLVIREGYLLINEYQVQTTTYMLENDTDQDHVITIEAPVTSQYELFDTAGGGALPPPRAAAHLAARADLGPRLPPPGALSARPLAGSGDVRCTEHAARQPGLHRAGEAGAGQAQSRARRGIRARGTAPREPARPQANRAGGPPAGAGLAAAYRQRGPARRDRHTG